MVLRTLGGTTAISKKSLTIRGNLVSVPDHMVLNKPSMTNIFEMLGNLVQFLCGHQSALEGVNSMGAIAPRKFTFLALAHKVGTWLRSLLHV